MAPTLVAARTTLPPEGAASPRGGPAAKLAPVLVAARTTPPPEAYSDHPELVEGWGGPTLHSMAPTLFTLV